LLAENNSIICASTWFADVVKSIKFSLEIITLVSSANSFGSVREFICNGRSFIYTFLGPQQMECVSVCWGPIKDRFARGVREGWQIMDRLHRGLANS